MAGLFALWPNQYSIFKEEGIWGGIIITLSLIIISLGYELFRINRTLKPLESEIQDFITSTLEGATKVRILQSGDSILEEKNKIISTAKSLIIATGSRSRNSNYLYNIEECLKRNPRLVHYRVLHGNPYNETFKAHLKKLLQIDQLSTTESSFKQLHMCISRNSHEIPESFICANESAALIILPSMNGLANYDTGLLISDKIIVDGLVSYVKQLAVHSERLDSINKIDMLPIISENFKA